MTHPLVLVALSGLAGCAPASSPAGDLTGELQAALDRWAARSTHYGVSAAVILRDGTSWAGAAGSAGAGPLRSDHLIVIASITKSMTGAVVLRLVDEGRVSLDDPLSRWIEPLPNVDPVITVRQLLNHTSGLANYSANPALGAAIAADPGRRFSRDELLAFVSAPLAPPGGPTRYGNTAFLLLAMVAERAAGLPIERLYESLWRAAGVGEIYYPGAGMPPGPVAIALAAGGPVLPTDSPARLSVGNAAAGMLATARATAAWGRALFTGNLLTAATQAEMRTLVPAAGNIPGESGAGLGIRSYGYLGRTQFGHSGGSPFGSSLMLFDPETGVTVAVLMNQGAGADHFQLAPELLALAAGHVR